MQRKQNTGGYSMTFLWWLVIISAVVLVLSYFFGRAPAGAVGEAEAALPARDGVSPDRTTTVPPDDRPDSVHMRRNHGHEFAAEVSPFGADGRAKVSEEPELFPDRTGATTARALGAKEKPQDVRKDKRADGLPQNDYAMTPETPSPRMGGGPGNGDRDMYATAAPLNADTPDPGTRGWQPAAEFTRRLEEQGRLAPARVEPGPPMQAAINEEGTNGFGAVPQSRFTAPPPPGNEEQFDAGVWERRQP